MDKLVLLKWEGSLIIDKNKPFTISSDKLNKIAHEIKPVFTRRPDLLLILGHGSGLFGHYAEKEFVPFVALLQPVETKRRKTKFGVGFRRLGSKHPHSIAT